MKPIRLGFIGCGEHAVHSHANIVITQPELFEIVAVFDLNPTAMGTIAQMNRSGNAYHAFSAEDLLSCDDVEAVVIATPPPFHLEAMQLAVMHGKHILCEKPLWNTASQNEDGRSTIQEAGRKGLVFTSCHPRRFEPEYVDVLRNLDGFIKRFGVLREIAFRFFYHKTAKAWRKEDSLLLDHMNHEIDLVSFLLGQNSVALTKFSDAHDHYRVVGMREDGICLMFSGSRRLTERVYINELGLIFERGRVTVLTILKDGIITPTVTNENFDSNERIETSDPERSIEIPFQGIMRNFALAIRGEEKNYLEPDEMIRNTTACTALLEKDQYQSE